jgi:hypothetical protein
MKNLDARFEEAMMVGYATQSKGYKLWEEELGKLSLDVKFDEERDSPVSMDADPTVIDLTKVEDVTSPTPPAPDYEPNSENDDDESYSKPTQEDSPVPQSSPQAPLRRSKRASRPPAES